MFGSLPQQIFLQTTCHRPPYGQYAHLCVARGSSSTSRRSSHPPEGGAGTPRKTIQAVSKGGEGHVFGKVPGAITVIRPDEGLLTLTPSPSRC